MQIECTSEAWKSSNLGFYFSRVATDNVRKSEISEPSFYPLEDDGEVAWEKTVSK